MKWASKKSSSPTSLITRVFQASWFSKSKQKSCNLETNSVKNQTRCYLDEDDAYWRLSFGEEERLQGRRSTGGINPLWYDSSDHDFSSFKRDLDVSRRDECLKFNDMVLDVKKMKEEKTKCRKGEGKISNLEEKRVIFPVEKVDNLVGIEDDFLKLAVSEEVLSMSEWQHLGDKKCKEMKIKTESHIGRIKQNRTAKAYSPRTECKIRALERIKKSRMKLKKIKKGDKNAIFDSFAVMKSSFDPRNDFRESMIEMISEKEIVRPEDLEQLLACYLTLNCDEYHDLIIEVFREVWLELNEAFIDLRLQNRPLF